MKPHFLVMLLLTVCTACMKKPANNMEIQYTSINGVYGNYVFSFKDNTEGIKKINDFAEKDIRTAKKLTDSINTKIAGLTKEEAVKYLSGQSFPTSAGNIIFYNAPGEFNGEPKTDDILIEYELDEDNFKIKALNIPNPKSREENSIIAVSKTSQSCIITIKGSKITLQALRSVIHKVNKVGYHRNSDQYVYTVNGNEKKTLLSLIYEEKGKYFRMSF